MLQYEPSEVPCFLLANVVPPPVGSTWYNLLRGGLEVGGGMLAGILLGFLIQYFPSVDQVRQSIVLLCMPHWNQFLLHYRSVWLH